MTHVAHELHDAFPQDGAILHDLKVGNPHFGKLADRYHLLNREIHLLWKDLAPVDNAQPGTPTLLPVTPTTTFDACPETLDVLFVPPLWMLMPNQPVSS